jgi:hypothetical protein
MHTPAFLSKVMLSFFVLLCCGFQQLVPHIPEDIPAVRMNFKAVPSLGRLFQGTARQQISTEYALKIPQ